MIRLNDDYFIDVDEMNYTLKRDTHKTYTDKGGVTRIVSEVIGYYTTLYKALLGAREHFINISLRDGERSLGEAVNEVSKANKTFEDMLYGVLKQKGE